MRWLSRGLLGLAAAGFALASLLVFSMGVAPAPAGLSFTVPDTDVRGVWTGDSYAYVVPAPEGIVLVDAGSDIDARALQEELGQRNLGANDVTAVLLTHGHRDHRAGAAAFPKATVYLGEADFPLVCEGRLPRAPLARLRARLQPRPPAPLHVQGVLPGELLKTAGLSVDVVALPGHTAGSVAYRIGSVLFIGDSLRLGTSPPRPWPAWASDAPDDNARALERLRDLPCAQMVDGHFGVVACSAKSLS